MSESNAPFNPPGQPESADSTPDWENPFADLAEEMNLQGDLSVEDLLFETDVKALPQNVEQSPAGAADVTPARSTSTPVDPTVTTAAWSENTVHSTESATESADVTDLISLIQELNQCNSVLLDRVSQLEEALESSQMALQAEVGRSQDYQLLNQAPINQAPSHAHSGTSNPADLASAQEQI
ncbi:MAG TPA: hypothetical protein V6C57_13475, partial [Coleofasciculaceae cyanobacterium]